MTDITPKPMRTKRKSKSKGTVAVFTGPLKSKTTGEPKLCDIFHKERAMWLHDDNKYLCFGCGDH